MHPARFVFSSTDIRDRSTEGQPAISLRDETIIRFSPSNRVHPPVDVRQRHKHSAVESGEAAYGHQLTVVLLALISDPATARRISDAPLNESGAHTASPISLALQSSLDHSPLGSTQAGPLTCPRSSQRFLPTCSDGGLPIVAGEFGRRARQPAPKVSSFTTVISAVVDVLMGTWRPTCRSGNGVRERRESLQHPFRVPDRFLRSSLSRVGCATTADVCPRMPSTFRYRQLFVV